MDHVPGTVSLEYTQSVGSAYSSIKVVLIASLLTALPMAFCMDIKTIFVIVKA